MPIIPAMHVSGISSSSYAAIGAGVRTQLRAEVLSSAFVDAGILDKTLADGLKALQAEAESLTSAGIQAAKLDLTGSLIDMMG